MLLPYADPGTAACPCSAAGVAQRMLQVCLHGRENLIINTHSFIHGLYNDRTCGSAVGCGTMLQVGKVARSVPDVCHWIFQFNSSRTMALGSTQPLTEMNTRNLPGGKGRLAGVYG
jgi:hypothetical protein